MSSPSDARTMRTEPGFGLGVGVGVGIAANFPFPALRSFRHAVHNLNWEQLFNPIVGQPQMLSKSARTHFAGHALCHRSHTRKHINFLFGTYKGALYRVGLWVHQYIIATFLQIEEMPQQARKDCHTILVATMQASTTIFQWPRAQILAKGTFCFLYASTFGRACVLKFLKYWHLVGCQ